MAQAITAGKAVFVEKPLAITLDALLLVQGAIASAASPRLLAGYNRRFAPMAVRCKNIFAIRVDSMFITYHVNAGSFSADNWMFDPKEGGGRILGKVCHFVDFMCLLTDPPPQRIFAEAMPSNGPRALARDSVSITLRMSDGSLGAIHYFANGDPSVPKEYVEVYCGQRTAILNNYRSLSLHHRNKSRSRRLINQAKGHQEEIQAFINAVAAGEPMPIDFETLIAVTQTTLLIHASLALGEPVNYEPPASESRVNPT